MYPIILIVYQNNNVVAIYWLHETYLVRSDQISKETVYLIVGITCFRAIGSDFSRLSIALFTMDDLVFSCVLLWFGLPTNCMSPPFCTHVLVCKTSNIDECICTLCCSKNLPPTDMICDVKLAVITEQ